LDKDALVSRPVQRVGRIKSHAILGGEANNIILNMMPPA
jgi:hypothetical protein